MIDARRNPLVAVHTALWNMVDQHAPLREMVRLGNRVTFLGKSRDPVKESVSVTDLPEMRLVPTALTPWHFRTSSTSSLAVRWQWLLLTGDKRLDLEGGLFDVVWELYRACKGWQVVLNELLWEGQRFVHLMKSTEATITIPTDQLQARGLEGWIALWTAEVTMMFNTDTLGG